MANTFKFGNGNWAVKEDFALAYNDENGNFKPLPFDFTRASTATRVDKNGLIETVPSGKPRIDFTDNTSGHLLLEPSRGNLLQRSEELDNAYWTKVRSSVTSNQIISPDGSNTADKLIDSTDNNTHIVYRSLTVSTSNDYTFSCFLKKGSLSKAFLAFDSTDATSVVFDLENGTIFSEGASVDDSSITPLPNGWYRCTITHQPTATPRLYRVGTYNGGISYAGSGTDFVYIWGAQVEEGSYPTSYIPTEGSSVTRSAEEANGAGNSTVFNDSEGVLYVETSKLSTSDNGGVAISNGSYTYRVVLYFDNSGNVRGQVYSSGEQANIITSGLDYTQNNKFALKYSATSTKFYVNGSQVGSTDTSSTMPVGLSELAFDDGGGGSDFYGNIKDVRVYDTALSDSDLQALTS